MRLIRFPGDDGKPLAGLLDGDITTLAAVPGLGGLLAQPLSRIREICAAPGGEIIPAGHAGLLAPVDGRTEVWAAGVTYERSRTARMAESENSADIYDRVYGAARPELFFKSAAWRVSGPGGPVSVRADSAVDVPEPELAAVLNYAGDVVGYTICNDMSSRSIEGENPLYLPQAKIYLGGCAVGPWIRPAWEIPDPYALTIEMTISRAGSIAWEGSSSTSSLRRRIGELAAYLFREDDFPEGVVLSTGTSLVPDLPFTLRPGDEIRIKIAEIGELVNPVVRGKAAVTAYRTDLSRPGRHRRVRPASRPSASSSRPAPDRRRDSLTAGPPGPPSSAPAHSGRQARAGLPGHGRD